MKIQHKCSKEIFDEFPYYTKVNGQYGFIVLTFDERVYFFTPTKAINGSEDINYEDITYDYFIN